MAQATQTAPIDTTFQGSLAQTSIGDLCQILTRRTGCLHVSGERCSGKIYFKEGIMVHAEALPFFGPDAFCELAHEKRGNFHFLVDQLPGYVSLSAKPERLLMQAAVYGDLLDDLEKALVHDDTVLEWVGYDESKTSEVFDKPLKIEIWNLLELPDTLHGVTLTLLRRGSSRTDIIEAVHGLVLGGVIRPSATPDPSRTYQYRERPVRAAVAATPANRNLVALHPILTTVILLVVLAAVGLFFLRNPGATPQPADSSIKPAAATQPAVVAPVAGTVPALDTADLLARVGTTATVSGKVLRVKTDPKSGMTFLDFRDQPRKGFVLVIYPDDLAKFKPESYLDHEVTVRGEIVTYRELPQIVLNDPAQIQHR